MAAMFESFSFAGTSSPCHAYPHVSQHHLSSSPTSPTTTTDSSSSRRRTSLAISDLAYQFSQSTLSKHPSSIPPYADAESAAAQSWSPPSSCSSSSGSSYRRLSASAIRAQRQANIRLLASGDGSHVRQLHALVERMVDAGEQCHVCGISSSPSSSPALSVSSTSSSLSQASSRSSSTSGSPTPDFGAMDLTDEPVDAAAEELQHGLGTLRYRRSGDLAYSATSAPCVRKDIKVRKQRRGRSGGGSR